MRNKKLSTKTVTAITALALIVAGTGTLGLTMTNAGQKIVKSEVKNQEVESMYSVESDATAKIAVENKNDSAEEDNDIVVEVPYGAEIDADGEYELKNSDDGTLSMSVEEKADESDSSDSKKKSNREVTVTFETAEETTQMDTNEK